MNQFPLSVFVPIFFSSDGFRNSLLKLEPHSAPQRSVLHWQRKNTLMPPGGQTGSGFPSELNRHLSCVRPLSQKTPGRLVLVTLQFDVDDGAGGAADGQLLSGLHLVTEVSQPPVWIHLKLLLQWGGDEGTREQGNKGTREWRRFLRC